MNVLLPLLLGVAAVAGCGESSDFAAGTTQVPPPGAETTGSAPIISSFIAQPATIRLGQSTTLSWAVDDLTAELSIDGIGPVFGISKTVSPTVSTTYVLTARSETGTSSASVTVTVTDVSGLVTGGNGGDLPMTADQWVNATGNLAGLSSECGNMSLVSSHPSVDSVVAGVALQGLWRSEAGGDTWVPLGQHGGSDQIINRPSSIVYDPARPETFWESGIYNGGGVYRTDDGGETFIRLGDATHADLVAVDLRDPARSTLLYGTHEQPRLHRSTDGGRSWSEIVSLPADIGQAIAPVVLDAETYLLGTKSGGNSGIFRTEDAGATWTKVNPAGVGGPALVSSDGTIYWLLENGGGLVESTDEGESWTVVSPSVPFSPLSGNLAQLPDGKLVAVANGSLIISGDGGVTWSRLGPQLPYDPLGVTFAPQRGAFYVWRFSCDAAGGNPVPDDAILRLDLVDSPA